MSSTTLQALPTAATSGRALAVQIARQMLRLVGAGWQAPQDSLNAADFLALAESFADLREELLGVWDQAFVSSATSDNGLLTEWERLLGLPIEPTSTDAARQARLLAYVRASVAGTPQAIKNSVEAYTGSCTIVETTADAVLASRSPVTEDTIRGVFRFAVVVPLLYAKSDAQVARISAIVNRMKPAHTSFSVVNAVGFYCDDSTTPSWTDTTALGT